MGRDGRPVPGKVEIDGGETVWRLAPTDPWAEGDHMLVVETILEDLAGNNLLGAFDREIEEGSTSLDVAAPDTVSIPFRIERRDT